MYLMSRSGRYSYSLNAFIVWCALKLILQIYDVKHEATLCPALTSSPIQGDLLQRINARLVGLSLGFASLEV